MPDFFDRLAARAAGTPRAAGGGDDTAGTAVRARPRLPTVFERPVPGPDLPFVEEERQAPPRMAIREPRSRPEPEPARGSPAQPVPAPEPEPWPRPRREEPPTREPSTVVDRTEVRMVERQQPLLVPPPEAPRIVPETPAPDAVTPAAVREQPRASALPGERPTRAAPARPAPAAPSPAGVTPVRARRQQPRPPERVVHVNIGRLEVTAAGQRHRQGQRDRQDQQEQSARPDPALSLDRYLEGANPR